MTMGINNVETSCEGGLAAGLIVFYITLRRFFKAGLVKSSSSALYPPFPKGHLQLLIICSFSATALRLFSLLLRLKLTLTVIH